MANVTNDNINITNITFINESYMNESGSYSFENPFDKQPVRIIFIVIYALVFTLCICGNFMVLFAIARSQRLRSMTNFLLANLAIADLCVGAFCVLPNLSTFLRPSWIFGKLMCKVYYYIWNVSYISSIIILVVIAIERYIAILHPLKARAFMTHKRLIVVQVMIWILSLVYNIPFLIFYDTISFTDQGLEYCYFSFEYMESLKWFSLMNLIIWYVIPLLLIGTMYFRVARALWRTTVVCALRLRPYPDAEEISFHRTSTRTSQINEMSKRSPQKAEQPVIEQLNDTKKHGEVPPQSVSDESQCSDRPVFTFDGKGPLNIFCGVYKRDEISPQENKSISPSNSDGNEPEVVLKLVPRPEVRSYSLSSGNSVRKSKYRQSCFSSSRRVATTRKKVIRLLISVVITFGICVLPHKLKVLNHYWVLFHLPQNVNTILSPVSFIILYLNSVLNPFLYALFSTNFRRSFKKTLPCFRSRRRSIR